MDKIFVNPEELLQAGTDISQAVQLVNEALALYKTSTTDALTGWKHEARNVFEEQSKEIKKQIKSSLTEVTKENTSFHDAMAKYNVIESQAKQTVNKLSTADLFV